MAQIDFHRPAARQPTSNHVQSGTAPCGACPYTQNMQTDLVKAALMAAWVVAVCAIGYVTGTTSFTGWTLLAVISLAPPVLIARLWRPPVPSMSEAIREVIR